ncbi:MAG: hypothetical protein Kow00109_16210 [Acidobacteriota bacterium]
MGAPVPKLRRIEVPEFRGSEVEGSGFRVSPDDARHRPDPTRLACKKPYSRDGRGPVHLKLES